MLTLVRHPRLCSLQGPGAGVCYGRTDYPADALHTQAVFDTLARTLPPQPIHSSPAQRCLGLAQRLAAHWQQPCTVDPRLLELDFGRWEAQRWDDIAREALDAWAAQPVDFAPGGGESLRAMATRVQAWRAERSAECASDSAADSASDSASDSAAGRAAQGAHHLAITHGGVMRVLQAVCSGAPLSAVLEVPVPPFGGCLQLRFDPPSKRHSEPLKG
jgi:alpha-ribazole phosphatase